MERARLEALADAAGISFVGDPPTVAGADPVLRYPIAIGEAAATVHALCADAALSLWEDAGASRPPARLDVTSAAASLASMSVQLLEGNPRNPRQWEPTDQSGVVRPWGSGAVLRGENATNPVVGLYQGRDERWIHLHGGAPHLADRIMGVLGGDKTKESVARSVATWDSFELEEALAEAGTCAAVARTSDEWDGHPQGRAIRGLGAIDTRRVGDARPTSRETGPTPLAGVRVLDLGDGLAGPTCARTLGRYGAEVLQVVAPDRGFIEPFVLDTGHGKRSTHLDLTDSRDAERFGDLLTGADVLCQSFRPGVLDSLGFPADTRRALNPGLVTVSINCYGPVGPWADRRGWEQLGQVATGLSLLTSRDGAPRLAPATVCDSLTGFLAAAGAIRALSEQRGTGGGWDVKVSLCQTAMWLGRMGAEVDELEAPELPDFNDLLVPTDIATGRLWHAPPVVDIDGLGRSWPGPPPELGASEPAWS